MNYAIYFVAFFKHDTPQHLVAGPFMSEEEAQDFIDCHKSKARCIIKTQLPFELVAQ